MEVKDRYCNVPIRLIRSFVENPASAVQEILLYWLFKSIHLDRKYRNIEEAGFEHDVDFEEIDICDKSVEEIGGDICEVFIGDDKPYVGFRLERLVDFYYDQEEEIDRVAYVAFAALKSIIQKQPYKKNQPKLYILSRMCGFATKVEKIEHLPDWARRWQTEKMFGKIMRYLEVHYDLLRPIGKSRGITFSFRMQRLQDGTYMTREKMERMMKAKKESNAKLKDINYEKNEVFTKVYSRETTD